MDFSELEYSAMIVAMKGRVSAGKSALAKELAKSLKCTLLSFDDVFSPTAAAPDLFPSPAAEHAIDYSYDVLWRLASADISGRAPGLQRIVIDSLLPLRSHLDQVLKIKKEVMHSSGLVFVVDCRPCDESDQISEDTDYNLDDVPHYVVNITNSLKTVEDIVTDVGIWISSSLKNAVPKSPKREVKDEYERDWEFHIWPIFGHCHALTATKVPISNPISDSRISCRLCLEDVSDPAYGCSECHFYLHKACFELPRELDFPHHEHKKISLCHIPPQSRECILCRGSSGVLYKCDECFMQFHRKCADLPAVIKHQSHEHVLNFYIYPFWLKSRFRYICQACGNYGSASSYFCKQCGLHVHVSCALRLQSSILHKRHWHPFVLSSPPTDDTHEYYCEVCTKERHESIWIYYCRECEYEAHISCINPNVPACHPDVYLPEYKTEEQLKELNQVTYDDIENVPADYGPQVEVIPESQAAWTSADD